MFTSIPLTISIILRLTPNSESLIHAFPDVYLRTALTHLEKQKASLDKSTKATHSFQKQIDAMRRVSDLTDLWLRVNCLDFSP